MPHDDTAGAVDPPGANGCIVLAAYRPDAELFRRQLLSIRSQTLGSFRCVIVADGGAERVRRLVEEITAGDERFAVIGADDRVGFYRNFERGLASVPGEAAWVALSDQDDVWHADKLERLVPHLREAAMVSGQARVVSHPSGTVMSENTGRRRIPATDLLLDNQFSGALSVLRRDVLDVALPFPSLHTPAQVHDHWLAVCASFSGGTRVIDEIVQDYVQHRDNVLGEADGAALSVGGAWRSLGSASRARGGTATVASRARAAYDVSAGWAELMIETIATRVQDRSTALDAALALFGRNRRLRRTLAHLRRSVRGGTLPLRNAIVYVAGWVAGAPFGARRAAGGG